MGEILGLTWDCVDMERGTILLDKTLCYLPEWGGIIYEFHQPKIKAGKRRILMTVEVRDVFMESGLRRDRIAARHNPRPGMEDGNLE